MPETTLSIRLAWPFWRLLPDLEAEHAVLGAAGIDLDALADPDLRIPHSLAMKLIETSIERTGDPSLGLRAGWAIEPGDIGPLEYAARSCKDLRAALECNIRYMRLLDDTMDAALVEQDDLAVWRLAGGLIGRHPAINEFAVAASLTICRRFLDVMAPLVEVRFTHGASSARVDYGRAFKTKVTLGANETAIVFPRGALELPLVDANAHLRSAFEAQAEQLLRSLPQAQGISRRVRDIVIARLSSGEADMKNVAKSLDMAVTTLRRRLAEEGTSHTEIVDEARRQLALQYLQGKPIALTDVAFLLGFTSVQGFNKAFRRWTGESPRRYRSRIWQR